MVLDVDNSVELPAEVVSVIVVEDPTLTVVPVVVSVNVVELPSSDTVMVVEPSVDTVVVSGDSVLETVVLLSVDATPSEVVEVTAPVEDTE